VRLGANTEIRLEGEYGENSRMSGFTNINDQFGGWDGTSTFDVPLTATPANNNARGITRQAATGFFVYAPASGVSGVMNYQNTALTLGAGANTAVPIAGKFFAGKTVNATNARASTPAFVSAFSISAFASASTATSRKRTTRAPAHPPAPAVR
jgi:hypothetical protein